MTPTDLQAVRAAAEDTETLNYCITQDGEEFVKVPPHEMMEMRNFILASIPPDAEQPVTTEWLREVWDGLFIVVTTGSKANTVVLQSVAEASRVL